MPPYPLTSKKQAASFAAIFDKISSMAADNVNRLEHGALPGIDKTAKIMTEIAKSQVAKRCEKPMERPCLVNGWQIMPNK